MTPELAIAQAERADRLGADKLRSTEINAQYWLEGGRRTANLREAVLAVEQAMNAYKNAAYGLAEDLAKAEAEQRSLAASYEHMTTLLKARLAAWEQVWDNVQKDVPDLRSDNKPLAVAATYELQRNALLRCGRDAERLAHLTADYDDAEVRKRRNDLLCRMPVMSHSAACADIDIQLAAIAAERKEGKP